MRQTPLVRAVVAAGLVAFVAFVCWVTLGSPRFANRTTDVVASSVRRVHDRGAASDADRGDHDDDDGGGAGGSSGGRLSRVVEDGENVALFVPLGVGLALLWPSRRPRWEVAAALSGLSAAIEVTQGVFLPHRFGSVEDWVTNTAGAVVGVAVVSALGHRLPPRAAKRAFRNGRTTNA